jgi:hypothetical protein
MKLQQWFELFYALMPDAILVLDRTIVNAHKLSIIKEIREILHLVVPGE